MSPGFFPDVRLKVNGVHDLVLRVRGGTDDTNAIVRVQIESELKPGQFSFSEQGLVVLVERPTWPCPAATCRRVWACQPFRKWWQLWRDELSGESPDRTGW